jgi:MoaA/NifB/PqqE/SkfB family radical SAM enzyme
MSWISELDLHGCLGVGFGGGEPTLYRDLAELCRYVTQETNMAVSVTTHAHRLHDQLLKSLIGNVHFFRISVDGVGQTYEMLRGRSFTTLRARLAELKCVCKFGINYVVNAETFADLDAATELAANVGAYDFLLLPEQRTRTRQGIDKNTAAKLRQWVWSYRGAVRLSVSEAGSDGCLLVILLSANLAFARTRSSLQMRL